jgi:hypothetical protein
LPRITRAIGVPVPRSDSDRTKFRSPGGGERSIKVLPIDLAAKLGMVGRAT